MTRTEHLQWAKERAKVYLEEGDWKNTWISFCSDISKHTETQDHIGVKLGLMMVMNGQIHDAASLRNYIEGFN